MELPLAHFNCLIAICPTAGSADSPRTGYFRSCKTARNHARVCLKLDRFLRNHLTSMNAVIALPGGRAIYNEA
jgi:hypothetical protein